MARTSTNETNPEGGGKMITAGGGYHFVVESVEVKESEGNVIVKSNVVGGEHADQIGKQLTEFFKLAGKAAGRALEFACAVGLYNHEQWTADKAAGVDADIPYEAAEGRQFCGIVTMKPYAGNDEAKKTANAGKMFPNLDFNIFGVFDKRAEKIPKCANHMRLLQAAGAQQAQAQQQQAAGSATVASNPAAGSQQPVAAASGDKWSGF